jgi:hypothetical protein
MVTAECGKTMAFTLKLRLNNYQVYFSGNITSTNT